MKKLISIPSLKSRVTTDVSLQKGFSLMEMMAVITIVAIISALAAPAFTETFRRFRVSSARDSLAASINFARVEAIRNGVQVVIQQSPSSAACSVAVATASDWGCGWTVFVDRDSSGTQNPATEPNIQTISEPRGVAVTHPGGGGAIRFTINRWGQPGTIGDRFIFFPVDQSIAALTTTTICINAGGRMRNLPGSPVCTNT